MLIELQIDKKATREAGKRIVELYKMLKQQLPDSVYETKITIAPISDMPKKDNGNYSLVEQTVVAKDYYLTKRIVFVKQVDEAVERILCDEERKIIKLILESSKKLSTAELTEKMIYSNAKIYKLKTAALISLAVILGKEEYIEEEINPMTIDVQKEKISSNGEFFGESIFAYKGGDTQAKIK